MLFTSKRLEIHFVKFEKFIYERILVVNKIDDDYKTYRDAFEQNFTSMNEINLRNCYAKNDALYRNDKLWVSVEIFLLTDLFKKYMNFEHSNTLNSIAWKIFSNEIIIDRRCAKQFVNTYAIIMNVNETKLSKIVKTIY